MTRLYRILSSINELLGGFKPVVRVVEHYVDEGTGIEYINMRVILQGLNAILVLREYWQGETLVDMATIFVLGVMKSGGIIGLTTQKLGHSLTIDT